MRFQTPVLIAVAALSSVAVSAQSAKPAPRTSDDKPDLSGFWQGPLMRNFFQSTGGPPFTDEGKRAYEYNRTQSINPEGLCIFAGIPRASISGVPFEIIQSANRVAFLYELMTTWRSVPINGAVHPQDMDANYFGNGAAKWDGDTLVIDIVKFKDTKSWIDDDAHPHSDAMHVVERWRRPDFDHLEHETWVEDPKFYTKPWTFKRVFTYMPAGQQPLEYACDENNKNRDEGKLRPGPNGMPEF
jgi:hypothetical protein